MRIFKPVWIAAALMSCTHLDAAVIAFDFTFYDTTGTRIGSGIISFEDYTSGASPIESFYSLGSYSWQFDIPSAGIAIGSSQGDAITPGPIESQGVVIRQNEGLARSLTFFDRTGKGMLAADDQGGIRFSSFSNTVEYISNGEKMGDGYFTALENPDFPSIPEPSTSGLALLAASCLLRRRRN